jgi:Terminase RNaseH-like domain
MTCGIIAHEREALLKIFGMVKFAYEQLPDELKPVTRTDTKNAYEFVTAFDGTPLHSSIFVAMKARGGTIQKLHITESAHVKDRQELKAGTMQAVPMTGWITEETTGNGFNEYFDDFIEAWNNPKPGELDYMAFFFGWHEHPEYTLPGELSDKTAYELEIQNKFNLSDGQLIWRRWKMDELKRKQVGIGLSGEQLFKQEYPMTVMEAFQSGAGSVFDQEKVEQIEDIQANEFVIADETTRNKYESLRKQGVTFWKLPEPGKQYVIGGDPSDGVGSDFGVLDVWDDNHEQVAQFYGKTRPDELAEIASELGYFYNEAFIGIENNMLSTVLILSKMYSNYYFVTEQDKKTLKRTKTIGWNTNSKSRNIMIDDFLILFDEGNLIIHSKTTKSEMRTFVKKDNGKREHADGKHDDALFAGFIAIQMIKLRPKKARTFTTKPF